MLEIANNIEIRDNNIYFSKDNNSISYPEKGNIDCYQYEDSSYWFQHRNDVIAESIKKYSYKEVFFDIGGGNGFVAKKLQNENIETVLVEPGISGATNAKKRGVKNVICSTLKDAGFKKTVSLQLVSLMYYNTLRMIKHLYPK